MTTVLSASDLRIGRGGRTVLDGVSLSVERRERALVQGPSGAGKSTLFQLLGLLDRPDAGTVRVAGTDAAGLSERERARIRREHVGIVFQEFQLVPDMTVRENVALPQRYARSDPAWIDDLLSSLGIAGLADRYPRSLSGGEKQRTAIARALANRPAAVLADEPTGQLDPDSAERVLETLTDVRELADTAIVVVSHDRGLVDRFDAVYRLVDGRLAAAD